MRIKKLGILLFSLIQLSIANASIFTQPSLLAVKGQIFSNDSSFDFTRLKITQSLTCKEGFGDGTRRCGSKKVESLVNAKGEFNLSEVIGDNARWREASYRVYLDGEILFDRFESFTIEEKDLLKTLLTKFTIYFIKPYEINFVTDLNVSLSDWIKNYNSNRPILLSQFVRLVGEGTDLKKLNEMRDWERGTFLEVSQDHPVISPPPFMLVGNLSEAYRDYQLNYKFELIKEGSSIFSTLFKTLLPLNNTNIIEKLSNVNLKVSAIDFNFNGNWIHRIGVRIETDRYKLIVNDPFLVFHTKCDDGILSGTADLDYRRKGKVINKEISGTCENGKAQFDLSFMIDDAFNSSKSYQFNSRIFISDITGRSGSVEFLDLNTKKSYQDYGKIQRCTKIINNSVCDD